jgi:hypothetical protein
LLFSSGKIMLVVVVARSGKQMRSLYKETTWREKVGQERERDDVKGRRVVGAKTEAITDVLLLFFFWFLFLFGPGPPGVSIF